MKQRKFFSFENDSEFFCLRHLPSFFLARGSASLFGFVPSFFFLFVLLGTSVSIWKLDFLFLIIPFFSLSLCLFHLFSLCFSFSLILLLGNLDLGLLFSRSHARIVLFTTSYSLFSDRSSFSLFSLFCLLSTLYSLLSSLSSFSCSYSSSLYSLFSAVFFVPCFVVVHSLINEQVESRIAEESVNFLRFLFCCRLLEIHTKDSRREF